MSTPPTKIVQEDKPGKQSINSSLNPKQELPNYDFLLLSLVPTSLQDSGEDSFNVSKLLEQIKRNSRALFGEKSSNQSREAHRGQVYNITNTDPNSDASNSTIRDKDDNKSIEDDSPKGAPTVALGSIFELLSLQDPSRTLEPSEINDTSDESSSDKNEDSGDPTLDPLSKTEAQVANTQFALENLKEHYQGLKETLNDTENNFQKYKGQLIGILVKSEFNEKAYQQVYKNFHGALVQSKNIQSELKYLELKIQDFQSQNLSAKNLLTKLQLQQRLEGNTKLTDNTSKNSPPISTTQNNINITSFLEQCQKWINEAKNTEDQLKQHLKVDDLLEELKFLEWLKIELTRKLKEEPEDSIYPNIFKVMLEEYQYNLQLWMTEHSILIENAIKLIQRKNELHKNQISENLNPTEDSTVKLKAQECTNQCNILKILIEEDSMRCISILTESKTVQSIDNPNISLDTKNLDEPINPTLNSLMKTKPLESLKTSDPFTYHLIMLNLPLLKSQFESELASAKNLTTGDGNAVLTQYQTSQRALKQALPPSIIMSNNPTSHSTTTPS